MERPDSHQIDTAAENILRVSLKSTWLLKSIQPDYGVDFRLELTSDNQLDGIDVGIQLKGTRRTKRTKSGISFSVDTKYLTYYLTQRTPTFLVVVDVTANEGWWLFLQKYSLESLKEEWRDQDTVTVHLPDSCSLAAMEEFERAIRDADRYMAGVHPGAIEAAIGAKKKLLESLDPRFRVDVIATAERTNFTLHPLQPVKLSINLNASDPAKHEDFNQRVVRGLPIQLDKGQFTVSGSKLFEELAKEGVQLDPAIRFDCQAEFEIDDHERPGAKSKITLPATAEAGTGECRVRVASPDSPLEILITTQNERVNGRASFSMELSSNPRRWHGQSLRHLAYFGSTTSLGIAFSRGTSCRICVTAKDNLLFSAHANFDAIEEMGDFEDYMSVLDKARQIAARFAVHVLMPEILTREQGEEIQDLFWVTCGGEAPDHRRPKT